MPMQTAHYKLIKPFQTEYYNVDDFNKNADAIDAALNTVAKNADAALAGIPSLSHQIWQSSGTYTFTAPRATTYLVECVGGGGGCTSSSSTTGGNYGGGGAYVRTMVTLNAGQSVTVTVGVPGAVAASTAGGGTAGGASSFGSFATAPGGLANINNTSSNNMPSAGEIRLPGKPAYTDMGSSSSYSTGYTGSSQYGTPTLFNLGDQNFSYTGQTGAGAGVGAINLSATGRTVNATAGLVMITYVA
ncbi:MAG: hypothetical protein LBI19_09405 [Oscillospiraceae bacterium]|jgi:hypothetical protein|nr:hypothetical protein [Oscillospiraceae bacterium]